MSVTLNFSIWISFLLQLGRGVRTSVHGSAPNDLLVFEIQLFMMLILWDG